MELRGLPGGGAWKKGERQLSSGRSQPLVAGCPGSPGVSLQRTSGGRRDKGRDGKGGKERSRTPDVCEGRVVGEVKL